MVRRERVLQIICSAMIVLCASRIPCEDFYLRILGVAILGLLGWLITDWLFNITVQKHHRKEVSVRSQIEERQRTCLHEFGRIVDTCPALENYAPRDVSKMPQCFAACEDSVTPAEELVCCGRPMAQVFRISMRRCIECNSELAPHVDPNHRICPICCGSRYVRKDGSISVTS